MIELFKMALQNPKNAILACLCVVVSAQHLGIFEIREAVAKIQVEQLTDKNINGQVLKMNETLIRIDENVGFLKEQIERERNAN